MMQGLKAPMSTLMGFAVKDIREEEGDEKNDLKKHVIANFIKRHNLKKRKIQRNKRFPK